MKNPFQQTSDESECDFYRILRAELPGGERRDARLRDDGADSAVQPLRYTARRRLQRRQDRRLGLSHQV